MGSKTALLLLLAASAPPAKAQYQFRTEVNPDGTVTVNKGAYCPSGSLVIPEAIGGRRVASIGWRALSGCTGLTNVTIPDGVTGIGHEAFFMCTGLTSLMIPPNVTSIGYAAFTGCEGLTSVTIGNGVTTIEDYAFSRCSGLIAITIPNRVTSIGDSAFQGCTGLTSIEVDPLNSQYIGLEGVLFNKDLTILVKYPEGKAGNYTIPNGVITIGVAAFSGCTGLTSVTIANSVTSIRENAFSACTGLTSVTIPDSVSSIGDSAFQGCTELTGITIPESVEKIGQGAFRECSTLPTVVIPNRVTSIEPYTFRDCTALTNVTIPASVASLGAGAFYKCSGLTSIEIPGRIVSWGGGGGDPLGRYDREAMYNDQRWPKGTFEFSGLTDAKILRGADFIGDWAFANCRNLTNVTIGKGVTSIGYGAFSQSTLLQNTLFGGDAPSLLNYFGEPSNNAAFDAPAIIHRLPGTKGWATTFGGRPTAPWHRPQPTILDFGDRFGPSTNGFSFIISWATNLPVVVEASADIGGSWTPISTNTLTDGWVQFADPEWQGQPARFYRVRGQ